MNESPPAKPRRRWPRYSLRSMMIAITLLCVVGGWWINKVHNRQQAVEDIKAVGGGVAFDYQWKDRYHVDHEAVPPGPSWLRYLLGDYTLARPRAVSYCDGFIHARSTSRATDADLVHLSGLPETRILDLESAKITDEGLSHLESLHKLEELNLPYTSIGNAGLAHLAHLRQLAVLNLALTRVSDEGLQHLRHLERLRQLDLRGTGVTGEGLRHISSLSDLELLYLTGTPLDEAALAHLRNLENLKVLSLSGTNVSGADFRHWSPRELVQLELCATMITDDQLGYLSRFSQLKQLDLRGNWEITQSGIDRLQEALPQCQIHWKPASEITSYGWVPIESIAWDRDFFTGAAPPRVLQRLATCTNLSSLVLSGPSITDADLIHLRGLVSLERIYLSNTSLTGSGLRNLSNLSHLKSLTITSSPLTDDCLGVLEHFAELEILDLSYTSVSSLGIVGLEVLPHLQELRLSFTEIDDRAIDDLAACQSLKELGLRHTFVTEAGAQRLQDLLPDCQISHSDANAPGQPIVGGVF